MATGRWRWRRQPLAPSKALNPPKFPSHFSPLPDQFPLFLSLLFSSHPRILNLEYSNLEITIDRQTMAIPTGLLGCAVVAVDGTVQSISALNWALNNLQLRPSSDSGEGGSIVLVHVQPPPSIAAGMNPGTIPFGGPGMEMPAFTAAIEEHQRTITEAIMNRALEICADRNVSVKTQVLVGNPRKKICEAVDTFQADLLVIGSRALSRLRRFFRGSVSRYCSKYASCPVIVVKGDSGEVFRIGDKP